MKDTSTDGDRSVVFKHGIVDEDQLEAVSVLVAVMASRKVHIPLLVLVSAIELTVMVAACTDAAWKILVIATTKIN